MRLLSKCCVAARQSSALIAPHKHMDCTYRLIEAFHIATVLQLFLGEMA
jgi:hypothetical protein